MSAPLARSGPKDPDSRSSVANDPQEGMKMTTTITTTHVLDDV